MRTGMETAADGGARRARVMNNLRNGQQLAPCEAEKMSVATQLLRATGSKLPATAQREQAPGTPTAAARRGRHPLYAITLSFDRLRAFASRIFLRMRRLFGVASRYSSGAM